MIVPKKQTLKQKAFTIYEHGNTIMPIEVIKLSDLAQLLDELEEPFPEIEVVGVKD
jgi:hypothetical protein